MPLLLELWDHDLVGLNDSLGHCEARLEECLPGVPKAFNLPLSTQGHLELVLTYTPSGMETSAAALAFAERHEWGVYERGRYR